MSEGWLIDDARERYIEGKIEIDEFEREVEFLLSMPSQPVYMSSVIVSAAQQQDVPFAGVVTY